MTSGTLTLTDTLPVGLRVNGGAAGSVTLGGADASNWTCNSASAASGATQAVTCTSTTALAMGGTNALTLAVQVTAAADTGTLTNTVQIAGGGETNTANNTASDNTTIVVGATTVFTTPVCSSNASLRTLVDWSNAAVSAAYGKGPFTFTTASSGVSTTVTSDVASIRRTALSGQPSPFGGSYLELNDVNSTVTITLTQAVRVQTILADIDNTESATIVGYNGTTLVLPTVTPNTSFSPSVSNLGTSIRVSAAGLGSVNVPDLETTGTVNIIFNSPVDKIVITNTAAVGTLDLLNFLACAPTLNVKKTTVGGTGSFDFSADNGYGAATLATTAVNTPVASGARTLTGLGTINITETVKTGWTLSGAICVDASSNSVSSTLSGNVLTLNSSTVKIDADIICTFTNTTSPPVITLLKLGRNISASPSQPFIGSASSIGVKPGETVEYCIVYSNTGGVASNFSLTDYVPVGMVAQLAAYGTSGTGGTGDLLGLKHAVGVALAVNDANSNTVTPTLTSKSGDDVGTLSTAPVTNPSDPTGSPQRPGVMTLTLPSVASNSKGTVCFQARVP